VATPLERLARKIHVAARASLSGSVSVDRMRAMNHAVDVDREAVADLVATFLDDQRF